MRSMTDQRLLRLAFLERLRESTAAACTGGLVAGLLVGVLVGGAEGPALVRGDADQQFTVLTTLLPGVMTVVGVVLSTMVVAQQLASQQYSPRAIRTVLRDRATRLALGALFGYLGLMVGVIAAFEEDAASPWSVPLGIAASAVALGVVAWIVQHLVDGFRADRLVVRIGHDTADSVRRIARRDAEEGHDPDAVLQVPPEGGIPLRAWRAGYLQDVALGPLARDLHDLGVRVRLDARIGDFVGEGIGIGCWWPADGAGAADPGDALRAALDAHVQVGVVRTMQREIGSDTQQLIDVALKALSPAINDPETAVQSINTMTRVLQALAERHHGWLAGAVAGDVVVIVP